MSRWYTQHGDTGQRDDSRPTKDRVGRFKFHHTTQKGEQFKTYELFIELFLEFFI